MSNFEYIVGIDEVGRGPIAGPVTLCAVSVKRDFSRSFFKGIKDSKKLSSKMRVVWDNKARGLFKKNKINFAISSVGPEVIDEKGISFAIKLAIKRILKKLAVSPEDSKVLLDGGLYAPKEFKNQKTIIKGDEKIPIISLASIIAKVYRDKKMERLSLVFPDYCFHIHKGYGTNAHCKTLKKYGTCKAHRKSFLNNILLSK
jgi:ribonuclease HII